LHRSKQQQQQQQQQQNAWYSTSTISPKAEQSQTYTFRCSRLMCQCPPNALHKKFKKLFIQRSLFAS
jgi:hypothetical protein